MTAEIRDMAEAITKRDLEDGALVFAATRETFSARLFTDFLAIGAHHLEEETTNDLLLEMVAAGKLREIGPGVYGRPAAATPLEHPLWQEDWARHD